MEELQSTQSFNNHDLFKFLQKSDDDFIQWLRHNKLLWSRRFCECGKEMSLYYKKHKKTESNEVREDRWPIWTCTSLKNHDGKQQTKGYFDGTFFAGAHLGPKQIFEFTYYWCRKTHTHAEFVHDMKLSAQTICDWKMFCRDVAASYFVNHPQKIGANGATVEIDETVICKPKYHRGKMCAEQVWFFGGIERHTNRCFMKEVKKRDAATLLPILQEFVFPGAVIVSDCWRAYGGIEALPEGYRHYTVNHSVEFVNSDTGQHTNTVEGGLWQKFKQAHKGRFGTHRSLLNSYVEEFLWRKMFDGPDVFFHFWSQITEIYNVS